MADKKEIKTSKKNKKTPVKPTKKVEKKQDIEPKKSEVKTPAQATESCKQPCSCKCAGKFILTVVISAVVTASIVITTPLWMDKLLPAEKQPAFLRRALMPVTNVKVIKTETAPKEIEMIVQNLEDKIKESTKMASLTSGQDIKLYKQEVSTLKKQLQKVEGKADRKQFKADRIAIQHQIFVVAFYNMYSKAVRGLPYEHELELMTMNLNPDAPINKDLSWVKSYKKRPPRSIYELGTLVDDNYSNIMIEDIKKNEKGLKQKFGIALNSMFKLNAPADKYEKDSLRYNLAMFLSETKSKNHCQAMKYGLALSKQSEWFDLKVMNELEARWKINKELEKVKNNIEKSLFSSQAIMAGRKGEK